MSELFLKILEMSLSASCLLLVILLLRLVLKKAPKWIHVLLWGLVALRLVMPFSIESNLSLIPEPMADGNIITDVGNVSIGKIENIEIYEEEPIIEQEQPVGSVITPEESVKPAKTVANTVYPILSWIWLAGVALMLLYTLISYLMLRHRVNTAVPLKKGIFQSENVDSPFVLGIIRPKIYLPFRMDGETLEYVIAHEQAHIRRKDHWWKPLGFLLLAFHWFNPLMWLGYALLCRDIELACDEKVIQQMDNENRANYTQALVTCSVHRRRIAACPLAFGEVGVKERVRSVMNYKKPAFWILIAAVVTSAVVAVCFLTNPKEPGIYGIRGTTYDQNDQVPCIELDYFFESEEKAHAQFQRGKWLRQLSEQEAEYTKEGSTPYDGSLGTYRMMLEFSDPGPSTQFRNAHREGTVYQLESIRESFGETVRYKVVYPDDQGIIIYIGTDLPFSFKEPDQLDPSGPLQIRLYRYEDDDYSPVIDPQFEKDVVESIPGQYRTYYRLRDGSWKTEGRIYQYRHHISGTMPDGTDATFVYLSNLETISFEQAYQASGFGDDPNGFFPPEDAILVDWLLTFNESDTNDTDVDVNEDYDLIDPQVTHRDVMISNALLGLNWDQAKDALLNAESHIILDQVTVSGTPLEGISVFAYEETVFICFAKERFQVVNGNSESCASVTGKALITFSIDEYGQYYTKEIRQLSSKKDLAELKEKFPAAMELLEEKEQEYVSHLKSRCWTTAGAFLEQLKVQGVTSPDTLWYTPLVENYACDINGDGKRDFYSGTSAELLHPLSYASYDQAKQRYQSWLASRDTMSDAENYSALAEIFDIIAQGSASEQAELAQLFREICNSDTLVFEDKEVFDLAKDYAQVFAGLARGGRDFGVQELTTQNISETVGQLDFSYLGEVWYSVEMMELGEQWVTGEFTASYRGEMGQYLAVIQFHDAEQSAQFLPQLSRGVKYPLRFSYNGAIHEMTLKIMLNADHGYDVYIGSDEPFSVQERLSVRPNRLSGRVSVQLSFDPQSSNSRLTVAGTGLPQGKHMVFVNTSSSSCVLLPFTAIMEQLGADVQWSSNEIAQIRFRGKVYTLNTIDVSLIEDGTDLNCILPAPGGKIHAHLMEKELMLDHVTFQTVALMLETRLVVDVDHQNQTVVIDYAG